MTATQQNYLSISRRSLDVEDYIDIVRRHAGWIVGPLFAGLVLATVVAYMLPNTYESKATMQITPAQVSEALVPSAINQQLIEGIYQMEGNILSRNSLSTLIQSQPLDLYPAERKTKPIDDVIEDFKKDLHINISPVNGSTGRHTSTFEISFFYPNRVKAHDTVQALIGRFQEENQNSQGNQQKVLKDLFGDEVTTARANLQRATENLTKFRMANQSRLPEQSSINIAALNSLQMQMASANENLNRLSQARVQLEATLQSVKSQMELAKSLAIEAPGSNTPQARQNETLLTLNRQIESEELRLQQYLQTFKETYPEVRDLRKSLGVLKARRDQLAEEQRRQMAADESAQAKQQSQKSLSPQMLSAIQSYEEKQRQTEALLRNNDSERDFRTKELDRISKEIQLYRDRLSPSGVDAQLADLMREQANATDAYQQAINKQRLTAQNGELIQRRAGELLEVLDSPSLPAAQSRPNRPLIIGSGLGISLLVGLALAAVQEAKDTSLKNLKDVRAYTNLPVLGSVPLLENTILVKRKRRMTYMAWAAAAIVGLVAVSAAIFYYYTVTVNT